MRSMLSLPRILGDTVLDRLVRHGGAAAGSCTYTRSSQICDAKCELPSTYRWVRYLMVSGSPDCPSYCGSDWIRNGWCPI